MAIIVALVEEGGANVNKPSGGRGDTPLMVSAREGQCQTAKYLLSKGADINAVNEDGESSNKSLAHQHTHHLHITCTLHAHQHTHHLHITCTSHAHHLHISSTSHAHHLHISSISHAHHMPIMCTSATHQDLYTLHQVNIVATSLVGDTALTVAKTTSMVHLLKEAWTEASQEKRHAPSPTPSPNMDEGLVSTSSRQSLQGEEFDSESDVYTPMATVAMAREKALHLSQEESVEGTPTNRHAFITQVSKSCPATLHCHYSGVDGGGCFVLRGVEGVGVLCY